MAHKRPDLTGHAGLAVAILDLAAQDVRKANGHALEARAFLVGDWAAELLANVAGVLGCDYGRDDLQALIGLGEVGAT